MARRSNGARRDASAARRREGIRSQPLSPPVRHGGLYVADLNPRRGTEPGKSRPVLVIQTDLLNAVGHASTLVLPCTSQLTGESLLRVLLPKGMRSEEHTSELQSQF